MCMYFLYNIILKSLLLCRCRSIRVLYTCRVECSGYSYVFFRRRGESLYEHIIILSIIIFYLLPRGGEIESRDSICLRGQNTTVGLLQAPRVYNIILYELQYNTAAYVL